MSRKAPNRQMPGINQDDGSLRWPSTDEEAQAAGLEKVTRIADGTIKYVHSVDRKELLATGEWQHTPW